MSWEKIGQFVVSEWKRDWFFGFALQPTPLVLEDRVRVYCGFRDEVGISRIGYVDLDKDNPAKILGVSDKPVMDIGRPGAFDDNGLVPSAVVNCEDRILLYYAGYQIPKHVRFMVFGGLAISKDRGNSFFRYSEVPVLDRTKNEMLFRVPHSVFVVDGKINVFYGGGSEFQTGKSKSLPVYDIRHMRSDSYEQFPTQGSVVLECTGDEHRLGRPYVTRTGRHYEMYFGFGTESQPYWLTKAESSDLINWERSKEIISPKGPIMNDDQMQAYPSVFQIEGNRFLLYNGNEYGKYGFVICKEY